MANGRLYLRNKLSGELLFMGKSFCYGYYLRDYNDDWMEKLNYFYKRAALNNEVLGYGDDGAEAFEIINEGDITKEDWEATLKMDEDWKTYKERMKEIEKNEDS